MFKYLDSEHKGLQTLLDRRDMIGEGQVFSNLDITRNKSKCCKQNKAHSKLMQHTHQRA